MARLLLSKGIDDKLLFRCSNRVTAHQYIKTLAGRYEAHWRPYHLWTSTQKFIIKKFYDDNKNFHVNYTPGSDLSRYYTIYIARFDTAPCTRDIRDHTHIGSSVTPLCQRLRYRHAHWPLMARIIVDDLVLSTCNFTLSLFSVCLIVSRVKLYLSRVLIHVPI